MSLDKAIKHGKEHRKEYYKTAPKVDKTCRCHGGCEWCKGNRTHKYEKKMDNAYLNADKCVCCGEVVPEGRMVCKECEMLWIKDY